MVSIDILIEPHTWVGVFTPTPFFTTLLQRMIYCSMTDNNFV